MKKHELLKYAYDNFPKGTKFKSVTGIEGTSTGKFKFLDGDKGIAMEGVDVGGLILGYGFEIWATVIEDRKPLLISEDGVELFDGDKYWSANNICGEWVLSNDSKLDKKEYVLYNNSAPITTPDNHKAFRTKQSALDWIEKMNKPKEIKVPLFETCMYALVSKHGVLFKWKNDAQYMAYKLTPSDIEDIHNALSQLK